MDESAVLDLFDRCSNRGRWGPDDEMGTLNYQTDATRRAAAGLVRSGRVVSLAHPLRAVTSRSNPRPIVHRMIGDVSAAATGCGDATEITPHGYAVTHLDALGHAFFEGLAYNGRRVGDILSSEGLAFGSVLPLRHGVFTRAVFLDVARARGVPWLEVGEGITPSDLDRAEALGGVRVGSGDAVVVRVGLAAREAVQGEEDPARRAGLLPECLPWLHEREVAVYSGDCIEQLPSPYPRLRLPFHMVGIVAMGLVFLDNIAVEELARVVAEERRAEFLLTCAPVPIPGGTGSAVNPLAVF